MTLNNINEDRKFYVENLCEGYEKEKVIIDDLNNPEAYSFASHHDNHVLIRDKKLISDHRNDASKIHPCTYRGAIAYQQHRREWISSNDNLGIGSFENNNYLTKLAITIAGRPDFYGDINLLTPQKLVKIEEINACLYGLDKTQWIPGHARDMQIIQDSDSQNGRIYNDVVGVIRPSGGYYPIMQLYGEMYRRYNLGLMSYIIDNNMNRNGINTPRPIKQIFSIITNDSYGNNVPVYQYNGPLEDFNYESLPSLGNLVRTIDEIKNISGYFSEDYYSRLDNIYPYDIGAAQFVRDYFSQDSRAEEYYHGVLEWWDTLQSSVMNPLSTVNAQNSKYNCNCEQNDSECIRRNCQSVYFDETRMQTRRDINEGLYNELNYYKENTYVDSGDGGKLKLSIRGNSQDPYDLIDKVTTIVNRISPGTVSSPDQNALIPGINDLLDSIYSETMIETRSGSSQSWRTVYGGQIRFIGNKTPEAIHQLEGVQDVTPSPDDDIEWILDVTGINYDDLYPIHEGYRQVANIMDLPEYGGLYHGRSMPGRSYTPPPGEINRVTSFLLQRNPAGLDKKVLTKPGTHRGTPKKIIKSVNSERNIVLTQGRK